MAKLVGVDFHVLADEDTSVSREYGIFDLHGDGVAAPATFIINSAGEIIAAHVSQNVSDRPTGEEILFQLDLLLR